jgi:hypothetical protein
MALAGRTRGRTTCKIRRMRSATDCGAGARRRSSLRKHPPTAPVALAPASASLRRMRVARRDGSPNASPRRSRYPRSSAGSFLLPRARCASRAVCDRMPRQSVATCTARRTDARSPRRPIQPPAPRATPQRSLAEPPDMVQLPASPPGRPRAPGTLVRFRPQGRADAVAGCRPSQRNVSNPCRRALDPVFHKS